MSNFQEALIASGLGPMYEKSNYALYGPINEEAIRIILRVGEWEKCPPTMGAHTHMNESSFRLYLEPQTNEKSDPENIKNPDKWDFGPWQINRGLYLRNVELKYYRGLPDEDVFGRVFYNPDGTPAEFNGNPLINAQAGARHLMRKTGPWAAECAICGEFKECKGKTHEKMLFRSLDEYRVGGYCGLESRPYRVRSWRLWESYFEEFFRIYTPGK